MRRVVRLLEGHGFTRNEARALLFLCATFLAGLLLRWLGLSPPASAPTVVRGADDSLVAALSAAPAPPLAARDVSRAVPGATAAGRARRTPVNINSAGRAELMALPGIGAEYADRILALRRERGSFARPDDLLLVRGIGPRTMERLRPLITVGAPPARRDSLTP